LAGRHTHTTNNFLLFGPSKCLLRLRKRVQVSPVPDLVQEKMQLTPVYVLLQAVLPRQKRIDENGDAFGRMREVWGKRAVASGNVGGVKSGKAASFTYGLLNVSFFRDQRIDST
jgi:hypothetical protein